MDCLRTLINAEYTGIGTYNLDDLPGISVDSSAKADANKDGVELMEQAVQLASQKVGQIIQEHYSGQLRSKPVMSNSNIGYVDENRHVDDSTDRRWGGIKLQTTMDAYTFVEITSVSLFATETKTVTARVYDLITGQEIDSFDINAEADKVVTKALDLKYMANRQQLSIAILIDRNEIETYRVRMTQKRCCGDKGVVRHPALESRAVTFADGAPLQHNQIRSHSYTSGLSLNALLGCSLESYVCDIKEVFAYAMLYLSGAQLMQLMIRSQRKNSTVMVHREDWKELHDEFAQEGLRSLETKLKSICVPNDICFNCTGRITREVNLPS